MHKIWYTKIILANYQKGVPCIAVHKLYIRASAGHTLARLIKLTTTR